MAVIAVAMVVVAALGMLHLARFLVAFLTILWV